MTTILDKIVAHKREELSARKQAMPLREVEWAMSRVGSQKRDFAGALRNPERTAIIAEIKKASPSAGVIKKDFDHVAIAREYEEAGVDAISVLTDERFFQGRPFFVKEVKQVTSVPVLRKDFIIEPYQIYESKMLGADAVLLIAAILGDAEMTEFLEIARGLGLECLVEGHNEEDVRRAVSCGARIVGINNRDLATFKVDLDIFMRLAPMAPKDRIVVCESGIETFEDVDKAAKHGADAVLVGTSIMKAADIGAKIRQLRGEGR